MDLYVLLDVWGEDEGFQKKPKKKKNLIYPYIPDRYF